jgi:hypothetical protein
MEDGTDGQDDADEMENVCHGTPPLSLLSKEPGKERSQIGLSFFGNPAIRP